MSPAEVEPVTVAWIVTRVLWGALGAACLAFAQEVYGAWRHDRACRRAARRAGVRG